MAELQISPAVARLIAQEFCRRLAAEAHQPVPPYTVLAHLQAAAGEAGMMRFRTDQALLWLCRAGVIYRVPGTNYTALRKHWQCKLQALDFEAPIPVHRRRPGTRKRTTR